MADDLDVAKFNGVNSDATTNGDMEALKQEILKEMRKELAKTKQEIIEGEFVLDISWWINFTSSICSFKLYAWS